MTSDEILSVAVVKREFSRLLAAAERGQRTVIVRHGRPVAALEPLRSERPDLPLPRRPGGLLALLGAFSAWQTLDDDIRHIIATRQDAADRPPPELD